jgi:hypothetical protein
MLRIVCGRLTPCSARGHLDSVCLGEDNGVGAERFTVSEIYAEMDRGAGFVTFNGWHQAAPVQRGTCGCGAETLTSEVGSAPQNDIAKLRTCRGDGNWA